MFPMLSEKSGDGILIYKRKQCIRNKKIEENSAGNRKEAGLGT